MTIPDASRSRYIPWLFVLGFMIVVAVNATMIGLAMGSFSGLYTSKPRDRGLRYNEVVAARQSRDALGWRLDAAWWPDNNRLEVMAFDRAGQPLAGARVFVELVRPAEKRAPLSVAVVAIDAGRYVGEVMLPARGNWDLDIVVERDGKRFAQTRRMFLK
jgi:nitrogen fixation protein FixH